MAYLPHWKVTPDAEAKLAVFCNTPAIRNLPANLLTEIIATACLIVVGFSFGSPAVSSTGLPIGFGPWLWGVLVWPIALLLAEPPRYPPTPALAFAPPSPH